MVNKSRFKNYGLETDIVEITNVEKTPGNEIIDKKTIQEAIQDGIKLAQDRSPEEEEKYKQIVTVLESIRGSLEEVDETSPNVDGTISIAKTAVNAILQENDLQPLEESDGLAVTKENISKKIRIIKSTISKESMMGDFRTLFGRDKIFARLRKHQTSGPVMFSSIQHQILSLKVHLPSQYTWFVSELGSVTIGHHEIYGMLGNELKAGTFPYETLDARRHYKDFPNYNTVIGNDGFGNLYCINGKLEQVISFNHETKKETLISKSFFDYLNMLLDEVEGKK